MHMIQIPIAIVFDVALRCKQHMPGAWVTKKIQC